MRSFQNFIQDIASNKTTRAEKKAWKGNRRPNRVKPLGTKGEDRHRPSGQRGTLSAEMVQNTTKLLGFRDFQEARQFQWGIWNCVNMRTLNVTRDIWNFRRVYSVASYLHIFYWFAANVKQIHPYMVWCFKHHFKDKKSKNEVTKVASFVHIWMLTFVD